MTETTVKISGMMCGMCEAHICDVIRARFAVRKVTASHSKGQAVILSESGLDEAALRQAIAETGYEVTAVSARPAEEKKGMFLFCYGPDIQALAFAVINSFVSVPVFI